MLVLGALDCFKWIFSIEVNRGMPDSLFGKSLLKLRYQKKLHPILQLF